MYHALLYGVVRDFFNIVLPKTLPKVENRHAWTSPPSVRKVMMARAACMKLPMDFNSPYRCAVNHKAAFKIEEWLQFVETFSLLVFRPVAASPHRSIDVLTPEAAAAWVHLRRATLHYLRGADLDERSELSWEERVQQGREHLLAYAKMMEAGARDLGHANLHMMTCHAHQQETLRGLLHSMNELWLERGIQMVRGGIVSLIIVAATSALPRYSSSSSHPHPYPTTTNNNLSSLFFPNHQFKRSIKGHVRIHPEMLAAARLLLRGCLRLARVEFGKRVPGGGGSRFIIPEPYPTGAQRADIQLADEAEEDGTQFLGSGRSPQGVEAIAIASASEYMKTWDPNLPLGFVQSGAIVFERADRANTELLAPAAYKRERTRESHWVLVLYDLGEEDASVKLMTPFIAKILFFVKAMTHNNEVIRIALCDVHATVRVQVPGGGTVYRVENVLTPTWPNAGVRLDDISRKVVRAWAPSPPKRKPPPPPPKKLPPPPPCDYRVYGASAGWFVKYPNIGYTVDVV